MSEARVLTCEEALGFLAAFLDGELGADAGRELETHLARCRSCYSRADFERRLKERIAALGGGSGTAAVPEAFAARMRQLMNTFES